MGQPDVSFTYAIPVNAPAEVDELELVEDTGASATDNITYNAALTGQITNDGDLGGWIVQFDHNGDGLVDGTSVTDDEGHFTYAPQGLTEGSKTIAARVKETGQNGNGLYGAWVTITFTLEQPPRTDLRILSLSLTEDTGLSATDRVTSNPQVAGTVAGTGSLEGITIQFDHNSDGLVDGTATTNSNGQFGFTPSGLPQGVIPLRARTYVEGEDGTKTVSHWYLLAFIHSSDPDGSTAQQQRTDLADYENEVQDAQSLYEQALATAEATFQTAWQNAEALYDSTLETARTTLDGLLAGAETLWQTQFAAAKSAYLSALATAEATFQTEMANFTGDPTSFALPEFVWPDPPSLAADPWTGQSQFHVDGPALHRSAIRL